MNLCIVTKNFYNHISKVLNFKNKYNVFKSLHKNGKE